MVDNSKIDSAFRSWAGAGVSLNQGEFRGALNQADTNKDGKLSRSEFGAVASRLGLSRNEADNFFNKAKGPGGEVTIASLVSAANVFSASDGEWSKDQFASLVSSYAGGATSAGGATGSPFTDLAGADNILDRSELEQVVRNANSDGDAGITGEEFSRIAGTLGVEDTRGESVRNAFRDITGDKASATADEVLAYFSAFADANGSYTQSAFDSLVRSLSGGRIDAPYRGLEDQPAPDICLPGSTDGGAVPAGGAPGPGTAFRNIAGSDGILDRSELAAVLQEADADDDRMLTRSEFLDFAQELGVPFRSRAEVDDIFAIIAKDGSSEISIDDALAYFDKFKGDDRNWSENEFSDIVTKLGEGVPSVFRPLAAEGTITLAALGEQFTAPDADGGGLLDAAESGMLVADPGVDAPAPGTFSQTAGAGDRLLLVELAGYANPFGSPGVGTVKWDDTRFNALLDDISGKAP
jgi:Ca2+-binding EF-hand superfamily protein